MRLPHFNLVEVRDQSPLSVSANERKMSREEEYSTEYESDDEEECEFDNDHEDIINMSDSDDDEDFDVGNFPGRYCAKQFETNMKWESRDELVEWVKKLGKELFMCLVIRRSNLRHVSLVCEHFGDQRHPKPFSDEGVVEFVVADEEDDDDYVNFTGSKKTKCTFELVGVPEKKKKFQEGNRKWILRVISGVHNHKLRDSFLGHAVIGRLTELEKLLVRNLAETFTTPTNIRKQLMKHFPRNCTSEKQISNYLQKVQSNNRGDLTVTQWALRFLRQHQYVVFPLRENMTNEVDVLFFAHPDSLKLLKRFPYVIIIDATYKTNKYGMPLVEIVGFTCTYKTFNIAYAFTKREEIVHYNFIMRKLLFLCNEAGVMPTAIMTDRELSLIKAIGVVFPNVKHLLCWVHIKHNIEAYCSPILKNPESISIFCRLCWGLFCSTTVESYEERLEVLKQSKQKGLVRYLENTWLIPYKENIIRCYTDHHLHFFTRTSNRVEGMHTVLKRIVDSSIGRFDRMVVRIHAAIESQISKIRESMEMSRYKVPTRFNRMKPHIRKVFGSLYHKISDRAFRKIYVMYLDLCNGNLSDVCDDYWMEECLGLPCIHTVAKAIVDKRPIRPSEIHVFWKQIDWEKIKGEGDIPIDDLSMSVQEVRCHTFAGQVIRGEASSVTMNHVGDVIGDCETDDAGLVCPTGIKAKGRPRGSTKWSTKRNPSGFEYAREAVEDYEKKKKEVKESQNENKKKSQPRNRPKKVDYEEPIQDWGSQVYNDDEEPIGSRLPEEPVVHMGVDFGVDNIDYFWYPFI